jgi:hypothetical protein
MNTLISTFHFWLHNSTARLSNVLNVKGESVVCPEWRQHWGTNRLTNTILQLTCSFSQFCFCTYQLRIGIKSVFEFHNYRSVLFHGIWKLKKTSEITLWACILAAKGKVGHVTSSSFRSFSGFITALWNIYEKFIFWRLIIWMVWRYKKTGFPWRKIILLCKLVSDLCPIDILTGEIAVEVTGVVGVSPALWY